MELTQEVINWIGYFAGTFAVVAAVTASGIMLAGTVRTVFTKYNPPSD